MSGLKCSYVVQHWNTLSTALCPTMRIAFFSASFPNKFPQWLCRSAGILTDTTFIQCEIYNQFWYAHRYFAVLFFGARFLCIFIVHIIIPALNTGDDTICSNRLCLRVNYTIHVINLILSFLCVSILLQTDVSNGTCLIFGSTASDSACRPIRRFAGHCVGRLSPISICIP